jgi:xanthine/CO dehydrogenase XdhC/CoxF family maturation factor
LKDIYDILREFRKRRGETRQSGSEFALATLVRAEGSSYRRPGARMLICQDGTTVGSLSGGCLEEEIAGQARDVLKTGEPLLVSFDTRKRFGCHGKIEIYIERVSDKFLADLANDLDARRTHIVVTRFGDDEFAQEIPPPLRLLIFGQGPDSAPIRRLSEALGWQPIEIVDAHAWSISPDDWTAAIVKSHNYGRDFAALRKLLPMHLPYVGLIGPRQRRDQLLNDLLDLGVTINAGFFSPAGLDLGAETPEEIALAIVSEIQRVITKGSGFSLRERKVSIHATECQILQH